MQGTAGTSEEQVRYGWSSALLLAKESSRDAPVPSPVMDAIRTGTLARVEEPTRFPPDVSGPLIKILLEMILLVLAFGCSSA